MLKKYVLLLTVLFLGLSQSFGQTQLRAEVKNAQQKGDTYQFDVYLSADQAHTFHSRGMLYFTFDASLFPPANELSHAIQFTSLELLNRKAADGKVDQYMARAISNSEGKIAVTWFASMLGLGGGDEFHTEVPTQATPAFRISMPLLKKGGDPKITLDREMSMDQNFYLKAGEKDEIPYTLQD